MKIDNNEMTEKEFEGLCEFVCRRISPEGSVKVDSETLYFAIFWMVCETVGELVAAPDSNDSMVGDYRAKIETTVGRCGHGTFNAALIADRVIAGFLASVKSDLVAPFLQPMGSTAGDNKLNSVSRQYFTSFSPRFRRFSVSPN